jgi:hypothetical protein
MNILLLDLAIIKKYAEYATMQEKCIVQKKIKQL